MTTTEYYEYYETAVNRHVLAGLERNTAETVALLQSWYAWYGIPYPAVTSGYRSVTDQRALYDRWQAGEGGISRPARCSWHTVGRAVDLNTTAAYYWIMPYWGPYLGLRDGASFGDPGHWDLPGPQNPPCAW